MRELVASLAVLVAIGIGSGQAGAENFDIDEMAAALVLPVITGGDAGNPLKPLMRGDVIIPDQVASTLATVTNGSTAGVILKIDVISGDVQPPFEPSDACQSESFICPLTGKETATFVFTPWSDGRSRLDVECSHLVRDAKGRIVQIDERNPDPVAKILKAQNGIMFVSVGDPLALGLPAISEDVLFGDAIVVDNAAGQAYSFGAITIQAGVGDNDGDKIYKFDNQEYARLPSALATNFLTPGLQTGANTVQAELILFTLDLATGNLPVPRVAIGGLTYNDDEEWCDWEHEFDCFDIVALDDIDDCHSLYPPPSFLGLGTVSGHLELYPQSIATANDSHDAYFGNGNSIRNRGVHGWIAQNASSFGVVIGNDQPISGAPGITVPGAAAWGRPLAQSTTDMMPDVGDDDPVLDADPGGP